MRQKEPKIQECQEGRASFASPPMRRERVWSLQFLARPFPVFSSGKQQEKIWVCGKNRVFGESPTAVHKEKESANIVFLLFAWLAEHNVCRFRENPCAAWQKSPY